MSETKNYFVAGGDWEDIKKISDLLIKFNCEQLMAIKHQCDVLYDIQIREEIKKNHKNLMDFE